MVKFAIALLIAAAAAAAARGGDVQLLDFTSPYCGPCQSMVPVIQGLETAGYPIRKVDTTREPEVAQQYGVTQIPCFVMLVNGRETERVRGAVGQDQLVGMFQRAMQVRTQSPDPARNVAAATAQPQTVNDPWSGAGTPNSEPRAVTRTAPLGPREPLRDAFSNELISSSVRLRVEDAKGHSYGTGTIVDSRSGEALVITCGHLFRESQGKGPILVELFSATADGTRVVEQVPGQVINYNLDRDIGLVSIRTSSAVRVAPIAPTNVIIDRGERLTSVGCDRGENPTALATRVTNVDRYQGPPNIEASGAPVEGRSGGGLFNSAGQLVGVCFAADYEGNEGLYTALESIHDELDRLNLSDIYRKNAPASTETVSAIGPVAVPTSQQVVRGQEPPVTPIASEATTVPSSLVAIDPTAAARQAPNGLNAVEQAAFDELMSRASSSEVVCIIRPHEPGGKSEVITLQSVSPEFVRALAERAKAAPATVTR